MARFSLSERKEGREEEEDAFISLVEKVKRRGSIEIIKGEREKEST